MMKIVLEFSFIWSSEYVLQLVIILLMYQYLTKIEEGLLVHAG